MNEEYERLLVDYEGRRKEYLLQYES
jgi:hypothetical protein